MNRLSNSSPTKMGMFFNLQMFKTCYMHAACRNVKIYAYNHVVKLKAYVCGYKCKKH